MIYGIARRNRSRLVPVASLSLSHSPTRTYDLCVGGGRGAAARVGSAQIFVYSSPDTSGIGRENAVAETCPQYVMSSAGGVRAVRRRDDRARPKRFPRHVGRVEFPRFAYVALLRDRRIIRDPRACDLYVQSEYRIIARGIVVGCT